MAVVGEGGMAGEPQRLEGMRRAGTVLWGVFKPDTRMTLNSWGKSYCLYEPAEKYRCDSRVRKPVFKSQHRAAGWRTDAETCGGE